MENVKVSYCQKCNGWVRVAILEKMTPQSEKEMALEALKYDLKIKTISRQEYKESATQMCQCD